MMGNTINDLEQKDHADQLREALLSPENENPSPGDADTAESRCHVDNKDLVLSCGSLQIFRANHNVVLTLLVVICQGLAESLWTGTVLAAYLKMLGHDHNALVGDVEALQGLAVLITALPVGYLADKYGRSRIIRSGGILMILTAALHIATMEWIGVGDSMSPAKAQLTKILLAIVMGLWGSTDGIISGPAQALYADSTPAGQRTTFFFYISMGYLISSCLGPIVSIVLFQTVGNEWDMRHLRTILYIGIAVQIVTSAPLMMLFDDKKALDEQNGDDDDEEEEPLLIDNHSAEQDQSHNVAMPTQPNGTMVDDQDCLTHRRHWIPYILFFSSVISSLGSGMTIKFFPLFFKDDVGMSPTQVQLIYVSVPILMAICTGFASSLSKWFGRVQTGIVLKLAGVSCLFCMVFFRSYLDVHPVVLVPLYIVRTALMNAPYPLEESILMDFVEKNTRARWKSLDSISDFGWCGSAAFGGYIADKWDYSVTFMMTAVIQSISIIFFALLLPLVPRKEQQELSR